MAYVIGTDLEYIKVHDVSLMTEKKEKRVILGVEHGLNLAGNPTIFNDKELANETLKLIIDHKEDIKLINKNILGKVIDGNNLDISKLKVYQIVLFDTNKDIVEQMKEIIVNK